MAYVSKEMKQKQAPLIKAVCKKYGLKASVAVCNHSTLVLNIKSGVIDFIGNFNATIAGRDPTGNRHINSAKGNIQVNEYWYREHFTGKAKKFLDEIIPAMKGPDFFDHSDIQIDYFNISHYISINIGKWDSPYELTA